MDGWDLSVDLNTWRENIVVARRKVLKESRRLGSYTLVESQGDEGVLGDWALDSNEEGIEWR